MKERSRVEEYKEVADGSIGLTTIATSEKLQEVFSTRHSILKVRSNWLKSQWMGKRWIKWVVTDDTDYREQFFKMVSEKATFIVYRQVLKTFFRPPLDNICTDRGVWQAIDWHYLHWVNHRVENMIISLPCKIDVLRKNRLNPVVVNKLTVVNFRYSDGGDFKVSN